ncbi:hypothetical protein GCM10025868_28980 [Angustibacter aerolatus]|uniref:Epoxide hydrolase N-terminal domain-containing protein n=1 Tax=Angustibacter aerolatus TaxID=1162965 RepID=A0ABQ6JJQ8_9ACTN|nr:epoxide hydrolase N-terminal domain-containing protein [Angustibacter aerolatus]GMA87648.1 hypothetical protein GCM10025868_28980 [Angustibacter aerolatus]
MTTRCDRCAWRYRTQSLDDLRDRLRRARFAERETVTTPDGSDDWRQGPPLALVRDLVAYWADAYDWRRVEAEPERPRSGGDGGRRARRPLPARALVAPRRAAARRHPRLAQAR